MKDPFLDHIKSHLEAISIIEPQVWNELSEKLRKKNLKKGQVFQKSDSVVSMVGFVVVGCLMVKSVKDESVLFFNEPSETPFVGVLESLISPDPTPSNVNITATTDVTIYAIAYSEIEALYNRFHSFERFGRKLMERQYLLALKQSRFRQSNDGAEKLAAFKKGMGSFFTSIPKSDTASYLGINQSTLSRLLKKENE